MLLQSKTALITGATGGFGKALAREFLKAGADLLLLGRDTAALESVSRELSEEAAPGRILKSITAQLGDLKELAVLEEMLLKQCPLPDILINNAAMQGPIGLSWENSWQSWEETMRVNLFAPVMLCRMLVPGMIKRETGKIINISGGGATGPRAHFSAYACSKSALVRFSETLAEELKETGIAVNCIAPGSLNTNMTTAIIRSGKHGAGEKEFLQAVKLSEENDGATIQRAAGLAVYLASSLSNGITGKLLSAVWDPWEKLDGHIDELRASDIYTIRRIIPQDRGKDWEKD